MSQLKKKVVRLGEGGENGHLIEFQQGKAETVVCPALGRCPITSTV